MHKALVIPLITSLGITTTGCSLLTKLLDQQEDDIVGDWKLVRATYGGETLSEPFEICDFFDSDSYDYNNAYNNASDTDDSCFLLRIEMELEMDDEDIEGEMSSSISNGYYWTQVYEYDVEVDAADDEYEITIDEFGELECELSGDTLECDKQNDFEQQLLIFER